jgi:predicted MFS family arabinose efflux permease
MYAIGGMLYAAVAPRALRAFGEIGLATIGGVALAVGYAVLAAGPSLALAACGLLAIGGGFYMFHTTVQTNMTEVDPKERGSAVALFATFLFTGQASGLWAASHVVDAVGIAPVFWCSALGLVVLTYAFRRRLLSSRRVP